MKMDFQDRIDDYILNRMSVAERRKFEQEVKNDRCLKEQLEFSRNVKRAICSREEKMREMDRMKRRYDSPSRTWIWWVTSIAAVLVAGFFVLDPLGLATPELDMQPMDIIRGDEEFIFNAEPLVARDSIIRDSIINDTIVGRDTVYIIENNLNQNVE